MFQKKCLHTILFGIIFLSFSCQNKKKHGDRGFYYWKTNFYLSEAEKKRLFDLNIKRLYVRFFDIVLGPDGQAVPVAKADLSQSFPDAIDITPVVFITNKSLERIDGSLIDSLSGKIVGLIEKSAEVYKINYTELQFDCDWNLQTKAKYFALLESIKKKLPSKKLSCTVRLHQVKYFHKTGIPPVDRGMLMFYNMGNLQDTASNSIFNINDAKKYTASIKSYPLQLDVALPVFGWVKHYRGNKVIGLINDLSEDNLKHVPFLDSVGAHKYISVKSMFFHGEYLQERDMLIAEEIKPDLAVTAADLLEKNLKNDSFTIVLYYWDSLNLSRYANKDFEDIYHHF